MESTRKVNVKKTNRLDQERIHVMGMTNTHTHTHPCNGPLGGCVLKATFKATVYPYTHV